MREHTMFVQVQALPWQPGMPDQPLAGVEHRLLSSDPDTGACTLLVRFAPGWIRSAPAWFSAEQEFLVLQGSLEISGQTYETYDYACLPAGYPRGMAASPNGAILLCMFDGPALLNPGTHDWDESRLVQCIGTVSRGLEGWTENTITRYLLGTGIQHLRTNPDTGGQTFLYAALPFRYMEKRWTHTTVQEMYLLSGEYAINDVGVMRPGAYAWWNPGEWHGPYGSRTGFMFLIRSVGGPLENILGEERIPVDYDAPYRPVLPEALQGSAVVAGMRPF